MGWEYYLCLSAVIIGYILVLLSSPTKGAGLTNHIFFCLVYAAVFFKFATYLFANTWICLGVTFLAFVITLFSPRILNFMFAKFFKKKKKP